MRVRSVNDPDVSLLLDNGVTGIVFPDVATAADARKAVDTCKFAPLGRRSVSGGYPHFDYRSVPVAQAVPRSNDVCLLVCMIETVEGMTNLESIAAVDGVDVLHLGSNDLLANMGKPGQFDRSGDHRGAGAADRRLQGARQVRRHRRPPRGRAAGGARAQGLPVPHHAERHRVSQRGGERVDEGGPQRPARLRRGDEPRLRFVPYRGNRAMPTRNRQLRFDLTSLQLFVAVAEELSLTKAAQREHLVLSAASKRIAELEDAVGSPLYTATRAA